LIVPQRTVPDGEATSLELNQTIAWLLDERSDILYLKLWGRVYKPLYDPESPEALVPTTGTSGTPANISGTHDSRRTVEIIKVDNEEYIVFEQMCVLLIWGG
jgi:hypothetical protein